MKQRGLIYLIITCVIPFITFSQYVIRGKVFALDNKEALPFVGVFIKGTTIGAQTDFDGKFTISAAPTQTLIFNYVGMKSQEIVAASTTINVKMNPSLLKSKVNAPQLQPVASTPGMFRALHWAMALAAGPHRALAGQGAFARTGFPENSAVRNR